MASNQETGENFSLFSDEAMGGVQRLTLISEQGLYRLVFRSKMPFAEEFTDWTCELLVKLRKSAFQSAEKTASNKETSETRGFFSNEEATRLKKQFSKFDKFEFAVVYVLLLSNGMVKIGMTGNLTERIKQIKAQTGLYPLDLKTTPFLLKDDAAKLESKLKEEYAPHCVGGEYFDVKFTDVCAHF